MRGNEVIVVREVRDIVIEVDRKGMSGNGVIVVREGREVRGKVK